MAADIARGESERESCRSAEKELASRLSLLNARRGELARIQGTLVRLEAAIAECEEERIVLEGQLAAAEAIAAEAASIRQRGERYRVLDAERARWADRLGQLRALEQRRSKVERQLSEARHAGQRRVDALLHEERSQEAELASLEQQLAAAPALRLELEQAREAELKARRLAEARLERERLDTEIALQRQAIRTEEQALRRDCAKLESRHRRAQADLPDQAALGNRRAKLVRDERMWEDLARTMDALRSDGQAVAARHGAVTGKIEARQRERERMDRQRSFVAGTGESSCPTCGTRLTAGHREAVERRLSDGIAQLSDELKRAEKERAALDAKRTELRREYAGQMKKAQALEGARPGAGGRGRDAEPGRACRQGPRGAGAATGAARRAHRGAGFCSRGAHAAGRVAESPQQGGLRFGGIRSGSAERGGRSLPGRAGARYPDARQRAASAPGCAG